MRRLRQLLFYCFILVYLILCPLTIFYALGYVLKPGTEHGITRTGLISLSTVPPGATVYVGRSRYTERTPTVLRDLLPGHYEISLWLKGYAPWHRRVPVESRQATVLEHILLLPNPLMPTQLLAPAFEQLIPLPETPLIVLMEGPRLGDGIIYNWKQQEEQPLLPAGSPWAAARLVGFWTVPKSTVIVARVDTRDGVQLLWLDAKEKSAEPVDLTDLVRERPDAVTWHPWERHRLFVLREGQLSRLDVTRHAAITTLLDHVRACGFVGRSLYALTEASALFRIDAGGRATAVGMEEPEFVRALRELRGDVELIPAADDLIALRGDRGGLAVSRPPYQLTEQGIRGAQWSEDHARAVCWQRDRLGLIEPSDEAGTGTMAAARVFAKDVALRASRTIPRMLPGGAENLGFESPETPVALTWIYTEGRAIEQAFWVFRDAYLLVRDGDQVFLLERPVIGAPQRIALVRVHRHTDVAYTDETGTLYYLDPEGWFCSLQVIPRWELLPLSSLSPFDLHAEPSAEAAVREAP